MNDNVEDINHLNDNRNPYGSKKIWQSPIFVGILLIYAAVMAIYLMYLYFQLC